AMPRPWPGSSLSSLAPLPSSNGRCKSGGFSTPKGFLDMAQTSYPIESNVVSAKKGPGLLLRVRRWALELAFYTLLSMLTVVFILRLVWMVSTSIKAEAQVVALPRQWIPDPIMWENYPEMWNACPFDLFYINSIKIAVFNVVGVVFFSSL